MGAPTATSLNLTWEWAKGASTNEDATGFEVQIRTPKDTGTWTPPTPVTKAAADRTHTFSSLTTATEYEVRIRSVGATTQSAYVMAVGTTS